MAYDSALFEPTAALVPARKTSRRIETVPPVQSAQRADDNFHQAERLVVVGGAAALGALLGVFAGIGFGKPEMWIGAAAAAPLYGLGIYFTAATFRDAKEARAFGCACASGLHMLALLAWPVAAIFYPLSMLQFWIAPAIALSALGLFASCWGGSKRAVYRACLQGVLAMGAVTYVGFLAVMGA